MVGALRARRVAVGDPHVGWLEGLLDETPEGFVYEGGWRDGEMHGEGVASYASGDVYTGAFAEGRPDGAGTMVYATGEEVTGVWENGQLVRETAEAE